MDSAEFDWVIRLSALIEQVVEPDVSVDPPAMGTHKVVRPGQPSLCASFDQSQLEATNITFVDRERSPCGLQSPPR